MVTPVVFEKGPPKLTEEQERALDAARALGGDSAEMQLADWLGLHVQYGRAEFAPQDFKRVEPMPGSVAYAAWTLFTHFDWLSRIVAYAPIRRGGMVYFRLHVSVPREQFDQNRANAAVSNSLWTVVPMHVVNSFGFHFDVEFTPTYTFPAA